MGRASHFLRRWNTMELLASEFKRRFAFSMYKDLKLRLGEMTFTKDFVTDKRGDLYPILEKSNDCIEAVENNTYCISPFI